jgi:hypothetical protein
MASLFDTFIPKKIVDSKKQNRDVVEVEYKQLDDNNLTYAIYQREISPSVLHSEDDLFELKPEVSQIYPFKIVTPVNDEGMTEILTPGITSHPTASQNYYIPVYIEYYDHNVLRLIDREFTELPETNRNIPFASFLDDSE